MSTESTSPVPWNNGKLVGQKLPLKLKEIWAVRVRLQLSRNIRDLALFNLAIDSKLRGSTLVKIPVSDVSKSGAMALSCNGPATEDGQTGAIRNNVTIT